VRGAIFDLDGTIVDNMAVHAEAFAIFVARHHLPPMTVEDRKRLDGKRNRDIFPDLFGRALSEPELAAFATEKETLYRELSKGRLVPLRGLGRLLARLDDRHVPLAIATSAPPDNVVHTLAELSLAGHFRTIARSDEVPRGKPWPDVFLAAASRIGAPPEDCVAFEDAPAGIAAAAAAGMTTVALTTSFARAVFAGQDPPADWIVSDFEEFLEGPSRGLLEDEGESR
jgi:HAD superfamily hydrolase (TIGR01509 family)